MSKKNFFQNEFLDTFYESKTPISYSDHDQLTTDVHIFLIHAWVEKLLSSKSISPFRLRLSVFLPSTTLLKGIRDKSPYKVFLKGRNHSLSTKGGIPNTKE